MSDFPTCCRRDVTELEFSWQFMMWVLEMTYPVNQELAVLTCGWEI